MELSEFYDNVEAHESLQGNGIDHRDGGTAHVKHIPSGLSTTLPLGAIKAARWKDIEEVLVCKREPDVLRSITRVVGYYSRVDNWNTSKLGELKDRQNGNYNI